MERKQDLTLSAIRVLAMLSIILGHWLSFLGINTYQLLSVGVEIFLFLSGYLYSNKKLVKKVVILAGGY